MPRAGLWVNQVTDNGTLNCDKKPAKLPHILMNYFPLLWALHKDQRSCSQMSHVIRPENTTINYSVPSLIFQKHLIIPARSWRWLALCRRSRWRSPAEGAWSASPSTSSSLESSGARQWGRNPQRWSVCPEGIKAMTGNEDQRKQTLIFFTFTYFCFDGVKLVQNFLQALVLASNLDKKKKKKRNNFHIFLTQ